MDHPVHPQDALDRARLRNVAALVPVLLATHVVSALLELALSSVGFELALLQNNLIRLAVVPLLAWVWVRAQQPHGLPPGALAWTALLGFAVGHGVISAHVDVQIGFPLFAGSGWLVVAAAGLYPARGRDALGLGLAVAAAFTLSFLVAAPGAALGPRFLAPLALVQLVAPLLGGFAAVCLEQNLREAARADRPQPSPVPQDAPDQAVTYIADLLTESGNDRPDATQVSRRARPVHPRASWSPDLKLPVLVVEQGLAQQKLTSRLLARLGYEATLVGSGPDAVEAVLADRFGLVLMDGSMPGMDGYEAVRLIRAIGTENCRVPIVGMVTASETEENADRVLECGMDDWVQKPLSLEALKTILSRWATAGSSYVER